MVKIPPPLFSPSVSTLYLTRLSPALSLFPTLGDELTAGLSWQSRASPRVPPPRSTLSLISSRGRHDTTELGATSLRDEHPTALRLNPFPSAHLRSRSAVPRHRLKPQGPALFALSLSLFSSNNGFAIFIPHGAILILNVSAFVQFELVALVSGYLFIFFFL